MNSDRTKNLFANTLLELSNKKSLADISVSDIISFCNTSRNTFYYHFQDKQELIFWIYSTFHDSTINLSGNQETNSLELLRYMQKYYSFFKQAFADSGQNCFKCEFIKSMVKDYLYIINSNYETSEIDLQTKDFVAKFYANASVDAFELIFSNPPDDTEKLVGIYTLILNNSLARALENIKRNSICD